MNHRNKSLTPTIFARATAAMRTCGAVCATAAGLALGGCPSDDPAVKGEPLPITHAGALAATTDNMRAMLDFVWRVDRFLDTTATIEALSAPTEGWGSNDSEGGDNLPPDEDWQWPDDMPGDGNDDEDWAEEGERGIFLPVTEEGLDEVHGDLRSFLEEVLLVETRIDSRTRTSILYRLDAAGWCGEDEDGAECRNSLEALDIRVALTSVTTGDVDLRVLAGPDRSEVALIEAHANTLAATINIGPLVDAFLRLESANNPDGVNSVVGTARGSLRMALRKISDTAMRATMDVVSPVRIEATTENGDVSIIAESGAVSLDVNLTDETARLEVDVRTLSIKAPQANFFDEELCFEDDESDCTPPEGELTMYADRLAGIIGLLDREESLSITGLLMGPLGLKANGQDVLALSMGDGRTPVDLTMRGGDAFAELTVAGATAITARFDTKSAEKLQFIETDEWMSDDLWSIQMPEARTVARVDENKLSLQEGRVVLSSKARPDLDRSIVVGECLAPVWASEEDDDDTLPHPFEFESISCDAAN